MSFDEYAEHIYQKHRLCVAITVLKTKPSDLSSLQYLEQLKSKMADNMDDDDVTICSDDFLMDYDDETNDSVTILKDFDGYNDDEMKNRGINDVENRRNDDEQLTPFIPEALSQATYCNSSQSQNLPTNLHVASTTVLSFKNDHNTDPIHQTANYIKHIKKHGVKINDNKTISNKELDKTDMANKPILIKVTEASNVAKMNKNITNNTDTQKTIIYTVPQFTQHTHYSASQNGITIADKFIHGVDKTHIAPNKKICIANNSNINNTKTHLPTEEFNNKNVTKENADILISTKKDIPKDPINKFEKTIDTENIGYGLINNINEPNINSKTQDKTSNLDNKLTNSHHSQHSQNLNEYFNEIQAFLDTDNTNIENTMSLQYAGERIPNTLTQTNTDFNNIEHKDNATTNQKETHEYTNNVIPIQNTRNTDDNNTFDEHMTEINDESKEELGLVAEETVEMIPYKVLEELSKVKMFLRKRNRRMSCDGFSTDSGYRSDSQIRSSNRGAVLSGISMNQSAYSLLNHVVQCPLVAATRDITSEIAQTLGQLINKLHEEETYPPFLEELLDTVDILLRQVYRGSVSGNTEFLKKDEFLERLLLLNKSIHIQKHTIEKITTTLTKFHEKLTDEKITYELTNIDEIENSCYIFHILEILLKKYIKNKTISSQSNTQLSQDEEKVLKKSAITDIWRRKWNPNLKESNEGSRENRCVLKTCSEILNKIVVDCVSSYSLVAFSALKCFNSMQS